MARRDHVKGVKLLEEPLENLCPSCFSPLKKDLVSCPNCRKHFKEQEKAFLKSLILPGWGDIYLGHRALGILELVGSIIVWVTIVPFLLSGKVGVMFIPLVFLISYHGLDGLLTYHMAKKGYMLTTD